MSKNDNTNILWILLFLVAAILSWYLLRISAIPIIMALALVGLKSSGIYKKQISFRKICYISILLSLWLALLTGMLFTKTSANSIIGDVFASILKTMFGWFSYVVLFSPLFYLAYLIYKKGKTKTSRQRMMPPIYDDLPLKPDVIEIISTMPSQQIEHDVIPPSPKKYTLPALDLLKDYSTMEDKTISVEIEDKKELIVQTLSDFGIKVTDIEVTIGASVTLFEVVLARGVSATKIKTLDEDIARYLKVEAIRIIPSVKNRGTVGIEVPNTERSIIGLKELLETDEFQKCSFELPLIVGKTINGTPKIIDLVKMPHILIAGATGQGKSVGLNEMIISLLYKKRPEELKFLLFDPKLVELSIYNKIGKQFLVEIPGVGQNVITNDEKEITVSLQALCQEMDSRLELFKDAGCRDLSSYKIKYGDNPAKPLPYIVVIIDEFADMMLKTSGNKDIRNSLIRLAQVSRAAGIHLIIATQRPSAKVIIGEISTNFPARIAFKVSKLVDSQIILDSGGAEKLLGRGDMIFTVNSEMERLQGAFIDADEVENITSFIADQTYRQNHTSFMKQ